MTMTYYTCLSGMIASSYGLQNASNNVANLQSPGFKRSDVFYSSLGSNSAHDSLGRGVYVSGQHVNFRPGNYTETGNPSDLAIVGDGFYIIKLKNGELRYTRDGEFGFNPEGFLTDKHSGGFVQGYDQHGNLVPISQYGAKTSPGKATHSVDLHGEFVTIELEKDPVPDPNPTKSQYEHIQFEVANIFDEQGKAHTVTFEFEAPHLPQSPGAIKEFLTWNLINASSRDADIQFNPQTIEFDNDFNGEIKQGANTISFKLNGTQQVTLHFGEFNSDAKSSVRLYKKDNALHPNSTVEVKAHDGYGLGKQTGCSFDDNGQITYQYDNGQTEVGEYVALALFDDPVHTLMHAQDNLFRAKNTSQMRLGRPNTPGFGTIQPQKIESANVDSTTEFANIVVLQRMFQACSQIMDIDKQLLETLIQQ